MFIGNGWMRGRATKFELRNQIWRGQQNQVGYAEISGYAGYCPPECWSAQGSGSAGCSYPIMLVC